MTDFLKTIRGALEEISVSGKKNIGLMALCMDALDEEITKQKENEHADDQSRI